MDGTPLAGEARYDGADLIQGEEGSRVVLTLLGADGSERTVTVERRRIESDPVTLSLIHI